MKFVIRVYTVHPPVNSWMAEISLDGWTETLHTHREALDIFSLKINFYLY